MCERRRVREREWRGGVAKRHRKKNVYPSQKIREYQKGSEQKEKKKNKKENYIHNTKTAEAQTFRYKYNFSLICVVETFSMHEGFSNIYIIKLVSCFETKFARALLHPAMMWHGAWMVQGARGVCVWNDLFHSPVPKQHTHTIRNSKNLPHTARMHAYPIFLARVLWFIFLYINNKLMCECGQRMAAWGGGGGEKNFFASKIVISQQSCFAVTD